MSSIVFQSLTLYKIIRRLAATFVKRLIQKEIHFHKTFQNTKNKL